MLWFGFVLSLLASVGAFFWALLYSRFLFDSYLRRHHGYCWSRLRAGRAAPFLATDATYEMGKFRADIKDDLGDSQLKKMKLTSRLLYRVSVGLWVLAGISLFLLRQ